MAQPSAKKPKTSSCTDAGQIPAQKPAEPKVEAQSPQKDVLVKPVLPTTKAEQLNCDVQKLMREVIPYTRHAVVKYIKQSQTLRRQFSLQEFWQALPLKIEAGEGENLVGYKAPWSKTDAETAMGAKNMYEAAINVDWLKPFMNSYDSEVVAGDMPSYEDLLNVVQTVFTVDKDALAAAQGNDLPNEFRKSFPFTLAAYVTQKSEAMQDAFNHQLVLIDGHVFVWAYWLHLFNLIEEKASTVAVKHHLELG